MKTHDHLVKVDEQTCEVLIYRLDPSGSKTLFTKSQVPAGRGWTPELKVFAQKLGENLLMDSPAARRLLGI